jgi:hypothetical protein
MAYTFRQGIRDEFSTLRLVVRLSQTALDEYALLREPTRRTFRAWDHADQVILEAANEQILRILEGGLLNAYQKKRTDLLLSETRKPRTWFLAQLAERYGFDPESLPGAASVAEVTRDANATKHRNGIHFAEGPGGRARLERTVSLQRSALRARIRGVESWLFALADCIRLD